MLEIIENKSTFRSDELVKTAKRDNNSKRNYLLVNSMQGKHVPAQPLRVLRLFDELAETIKELCQSQRVLFIGFAETATAIGAAVSSHFESSVYVHTTREIRDEKYLAAQFHEEHSHAVNQSLYCRDFDKILSETDLIVFVEDEITTGKTILNFMSCLKQNPAFNNRIKFAACSVLNGADDERLSFLSVSGLECFWLMRVKAVPDSDEVYTGISSIAKERGLAYNEYILSSCADPRLGVSSCEYKKSCCDLAEKITSQLVQDTVRSAAVIGTEECMYPAIITAAFMAEKMPDADIVTHSTTRSPVVAENTPDYPLASRYSIRSFYDKDRKTFIYNSDVTAYDVVVVITDAVSNSYGKCMESIMSAFNKTQKFILIRWGEKS
ncbi:MAG: phosphoribosyltransferase domain-containing protein [Oscillospiraceae bacterium]|nr:phosphoribosyltransferase domain-containing protein [Oscillospiraceae bacterium]